MEPGLAPRAAILDLDTDLLLNCLDGVSDAEARDRLAGGGNSIAFLAAHLQRELSKLTEADLALPDSHQFQIGDPPARHDRVSGVRAVGVVARHPRRP